MATTTNIGLTKPAGTDKALVSVLNANSDIIDSTAGGLMDAIAIVANGNTHAAISALQYVYVHNHGTLAEGLYTANSAIAANATLTTSNLTADASGGLNALNSNITDKTNAIMRYTSLTVDGNTCDDGIIITSNGANTNLADNGSRSVVATFTLYNNPIRKVQIQLTMNDMYHRAYTGSWTNWQKFTKTSIS